MEATRLVEQGVEDDALARRGGDGEEIKSVEARKVFVLRKPSEIWRRAREPHHEVAAPLAAADVVALGWGRSELEAELARMQQEAEKMTPATAEEDRSPPRSENQGFRRNYFSFFGNPLTPNSSKFEISPKFCEAFFNPVKFRQNFIKICSKTLEIDSKFAKDDEIWWKNLQK